MNPSRREVLVLLAALAAAGCGRGGTDRLDPLIALRLDRKQARAIGRAWLDRRSEEHPHVLAHRVLGEGAPATPSALWAHVRQRVRDDFDAGRTERLQGWLLSKTELALYGFIALQPG